MSVSAITVTEYPKNESHVRNLTLLCNRILDVCTELEFSPVLSGSMAVFAYTKRRDFEVRDFDLSCPESYFTRLKAALKERSLAVTITDWHVLQVRDGELKVEFDSQEFWMAALKRQTRFVDLYGMQLKIIGCAALQELYRRGVKALVAADDSLGHEKRAVLVEKIRILELLT